MASPRLINVWTPDGLQGRQHSVARKPVGSHAQLSPPGYTHADASVVEPMMARYRDPARPLVQASPHSDAHIQHDAQLPKQPTTSVRHLPSYSPPRRNSITQKRPGRIFRAKGWSLELLCVLISLGSVASVFAVLRWFDGRPLSEWDFEIAMSSQTPIKISLNFVVSLLGIVAKSSTAVVLSSGLSQLKWNWFAAQRRPIRDFEVFDSASRGLAGSLQLLWRTRAVRIASLGALLTILSIAFDPFFQLLIDYPGRIMTSPDSTATLPLAHQYAGGSEIQHRMAIITGPDQTEMPSREIAADADMVGAVQNALWNMNTRIEPDYRCTGGNCTWPEQVSLAVCSVCHDISDEIKVSHPDEYSCIADPDAGTMVMTDATVYSLDSPIGIFWVACDQKLLQSKTTALPNETFHFRDSQTLLMSFTTLWVGSWHNISKREPAMHATECGLTLCSNTYSAKVELGKYSEAITESQSERLPSSFQLVKPSFANGTSLINKDWVPLGPTMQFPANRTDFEVQLSKKQAELAQAGSFSLPQHSAYSIVQLLTSTFDPLSAQTNITNLQNSLQYGSAALQAVWSAPSLDTVFGNIAYDLSSVIRTNGAQSSSDNKGVQFRQTGSSQQYAVMISIRWPFMAGPLTIVVLAAVFLLAAILQTRLVRTPVWKEGALATLIWGLDADTRQMAREAWAQPGFEKQSIDLAFRGNKISGELIHNGAQHGSPQSL